MYRFRALKKNILTLLILVAAFTGAKAFAAGANLLVLGGPSCGKWIVEAKNESAAGLAYGFWVTGYLSGAAYGVQRDILRGKPDKEGLMLWISNYCQKNPLASVADAAQELIAELLKKNGQ